MDNLTTFLTNCAHCGKEFRCYLKRPRLYCSRACYHAAHAAPLTTAICKTCGKVFEIKKSYEGRYVYCSKTCRMLSRQPRVCGVYMIKCFANGMIYIGSSTDVYRRWRSHRSKLSLGYHENPHLQKDYSTYGADSFIFCLVTNTDKSNLHRAEQFVLDNIEASQLYNVHPQADSAAGRKLTPEQREQVSQRNKGRIITEEHRRKLSTALTGRTFTEEHRRNISRAKRK